MKSLFLFVFSVVVPISVLFLFIFIYPSFSRSGLAFLLGYCRARPERGEWEREGERQREPMQHYPRAEPHQRKEGLGLIGRGGPSFWVLGLPMCFGVKCGLPCWSSGVSLTFWGRAFLPSWSGVVSPFLGVWLIFLLGVGVGSSTFLLGFGAPQEGMRRKGKK